MPNRPKLSFKTFGSGKKHIIFLHGYCEVKEMWDGFIPKFSGLFKNYTFISLDLPGFGQSPISREINSLENVADSIADFLKSTNINSAIWIGHSLGAYVLMSLLRNNESMINGLCFFHSSIFEDKPEKKAQRNKVIEFISENGKETFIKSFIPNLFYSEKKDQLQAQIENSISQALQNSELSMLHYMEMMRDRADLSQLLKSSNFPVHFIAGRNDTSVPMDISEKQSKYIRRSSSLVIEDCGHMGMFEKPDLCSKSITTFIKNSFSDI